MRLLDREKLMIESLPFLAQKAYVAQSLEYEIARSAFRTNEVAHTTSQWCLHQ